MPANYDSIHSGNQGQSPYGSGDPYYNESTGYITPNNAPKKGTSKWIKIGIPVAVIVIVAAVVGGVLGSRASDDDSSASSSGSTAAASSAVSAKNEIGIFATATNSEYMIPVYPSTTNEAAFTTPTFQASSDLQWPEDSFKPSTPSVTTVRDDRPRLIAPKYMLDALPDRIQQDIYLQSWNDTIFGNATDYYSADPVTYYLDGDSGALDVNREVKMRVKAFAYAYHMSGDTKWVDRTYSELENAASDTWGEGNNASKWNPSHFLDTAEMSAAFAIAYDWMYDMWTDEQKTNIRTWLLTYGLQPGLATYTDSSNYYGWWQKNTTGNWNCVCNGGLTMGSLAILGDDDTGTAESLLGYTVDNAKENCVNAPSSDGTWAETANYWYFGNTGHAEMTASLISATGDDYGMLDANPDYYKTGLFHMYVTGATSLFNYGDHGPNKFTATANALHFYAQQYEQPVYSLFQRDQHDSAEPWSMFWYDPSISGAFWNDLALDMYFDNELDQWASMRSSWTDSNALYVAMKAGKNQGHQTHNDLDVGDFVVDALGTRWFGELGSGDYLSTNYFSNDEQDSDRWKYYRKMTEGQNTVLIGAANQLVTATPTVSFDTSGTKQGSSTVLDLEEDSTAYFTMDMTSAYDDVTSMKRGIRLLNKRRQVLIRDEIDATGSVMWRAHTNATVTIDDSGTSATMELDGKTMKISMQNPPSGAKFTTMEAKRLDSDVTPPVPDQENPGVTVLCVELDAGTYTLEMLMNPQWDGMSDSDFVTPSDVALDDWSLTSHN
ncbi:chondroitin AC/alginate lyase [Schizophyllum amplum]|uniref:Chondroitin AC/alginate lyase n=1 Tax=Schizophyllum amplum TaxID=97359 RepID=A0A550CNQ8_9AGAR|nr:chondroitin AC/alginate lyase [Auriculariopsis ampla]